MRALIGLIVIVYFVGVGVVLAPTFSGRWATGTASELFANVVQALPGALAWPASVYRNLTGRGDAPTSAPQIKNP
jgi:hypothetical protein